MARQRFGATKADRQFCDFQRVKESERLFLSALQIEGKGRSCACAVSLVYIPLSVIFRKAEIDHACHLWLLTQPCADARRIFSRPAHAKFQRLQTPQKHPGAVWVKDGADGVAHHPAAVDKIGRGSCRERVGTSGEISGVAVSLKKKKINTI